MYPYSIVIIVPKSSRYYSFSVEAASFVEAVSAVFQEREDLSGGMFSIYCKRPKSGDLQYMAGYDGKSFFMANGERFSFLLTLADGRVYRWNGREFRREIIDIRAFCAS